MTLHGIFMYEITEYSISLTFLVSTTRFSEIKISGGSPSGRITQKAEEITQHLLYCTVCLCFVWPKR